MKKLIIITAIFLFYFQAISQNNTDFRKTKWGSSLNEVKKTETNKISIEATDILSYEETVATFNCDLVYFFNKDTLFAASYIFKIKHTNKSDYINDYDRLQEILENKYGIPTIDKINWKNDLFKDDKSNYGLAISLGHLEYTSVWNTEVTRIYLELKGENNKIKLNITYESKEYIKAVYNNSNKKELDKL